MSVNIYKQILITRSALEMVSDIHDLKKRTSFPHVNSTGIAQSQLFDLLEGLDPLIPYYFKKYTVTTTADETGSFHWTFLPEYTSDSREELSSCKAQAEQASEFLAGRLFQDSMPDYIKVYRACAFLSSFLTFENNPDAHPHIHNPYGAFIKGSCSCQGYALALRLLLCRAGVPCMTISGTVTRDTLAFRLGRFEQDLRTRATRHYWNLVGIETTHGIQYFHVDVCWGQQNQEMHLDYFLKDDLYMKSYLKWDEEPYPPCTVLPGENIETLIKAGC